MLRPEEVIEMKPAWAAAFELTKSEKSQQMLAAGHSGEQGEIRLRARMMATVDEGVGMPLEGLEGTGQIDKTFILFELVNLAQPCAYQELRDRPQRQLRRLAVEALGL